MEMEGANITLNVALYYQKMTVYTSLHSTHFHCSFDHSFISNIIKPYFHIIRICVFLPANINASNRN